MDDKGWPPGTTHRGQRRVHVAQDLETVRVVVPDEPVGRLQDGPPRAIVPPQDDVPQRPIAARDPGQPLADGPAERIDGLVIVTDERDIAFRTGKRADQGELLRVGVLCLVHHDVAKPQPQGRSDRGALLEQAHGVRHLVAVVDERALREQSLVHGIRPGHLGQRAGLVQQGGHRLASRVIRVIPDGGPRSGLQVGRVGGQILRADAFLLGAGERCHERGQESRGITERQEPVEAEVE